MGKKNKDIGGSGAYEFRTYQPIACYYTDGSVRCNGQEDSIGAYGFIRIDGISMVDSFISRAEIGVTNARMELKAILSACKDAESKFGGKLGCITICTDYALFVRGVEENWYDRWAENGWKKSDGKKPKHLGLWTALSTYFHDPRYKFIKVAGHSGDIYNEYIDNAVQNKTFEAKFSPFCVFDGNLCDFATPIKCQFYSETPKIAQNPLVARVSEKITCKPLCIKPFESKFGKFRQDCRHHQKLTTIKLRFYVLITKYHAK